jgi:glycerol-3-phosphate acyltransferase PlsY
VLTALFAILLTYLLASFPTGLVLAWVWADMDVRTAGSGNTGATNVGRLAGRRLGGITLAGDAAKGFLPVLLAPLVFDDPTYVGAVALAAFAGHCWSVFLGFRGGKGVATAAGALLGIAPGPALVAVVTWLLVVKITRRASIAALVSAALLPILCMLLEPEAAWVAVSLALGVAWRHRANVSRLREGVELTTADR